MKLIRDAKVYTKTLRREGGKNVSCAEVNASKKISKIAHRRSYVGAIDTEAIITTKRLFLGTWEHVLAQKSEKQDRPVKFFKVSKQNSFERKPFFARKSQDKKYNIRNRARLALPHKNIFWTLNGNFPSLVLLLKIHLAGRSRASQPALDAWENIHYLEKKKRQNENHQKSV